MVMLHLSLLITNLIMSRRNTTRLTHLLQHRSMTRRLRTIRMRDQPRFVLYTCLMLRTRVHVRVFEIQDGSTTDVEATTAEIVSKAYKDDTPAGQCKILRSSSS